jgi:hypothetical protein
MKCDLCQREDARRGHLLCQACAEAIARLLWIGERFSITAETVLSNACVTEDEYYFQLYGACSVAAGVTAKSSAAEAEDMRSALAPIRQLFRTAPRRV